MAISTAPRPAHQDVLDALARCVNACEHYATTCLGENDTKMMVSCIHLDRDCADMRRLTAAFIAHSSDYTKHMLEECIEIYQKCSADCAQHQSIHRQACAAACQACLVACKPYKVPVRTLPVVCHYNKQGPQPMRLGALFVVVTGCFTANRATCGRASPSGGTRSRSGP